MTLHKYLSDLVDNLFYDLFSVKNVKEWSNRKKNIPDTIFFLAEI